MRSLVGVCELDGRTGERTEVLFRIGLVLVISRSGNKEQVTVILGFLLPPFPTLFLGLEKAADTCNTVQSNTM